MKELTPEQRRARIESAVKIIGFLIAGFFVAPVVFVAVKGLLGMALAAMVAIGIIQLAPLAAMKFANWRLKAIKAEAMKNPVETLQNEYAKKQQALADYKVNISTFAAQVLAFGDQVKQYVRDGLEDAPVYVEQLDKMKMKLERDKRKYGEAQDMLAEFSATIERTDRKWKMAMAAMAMNNAAGEIEGDVFSKIKIETSLDSVQEKLNRSFADLDIALMDDARQKAKELPPARMQVIIEPTQNQKVKTV